MEDSEKPQQGTSCSASEPGGCWSCRVSTNLLIFLLCSKSMRILRYFLAVAGVQIAGVAIPPPPVTTLFVPVFRTVFARPNTIALEPIRSETLRCSHSPSLVNFA